MASLFMSTLPPLLRMLVATPAGVAVTDSDFSGEGAPAGILVTRSVPGLKNCSVISLPFTSAFMPPGDFFHVLGGHMRDAERYCERTGY